MSEERAEYGLVPDLKRVREAIGVAIADGCDPESVALSMPQRDFEDEIVSSRGGIASKCVVHYVWARIGSAHYEAAAPYCSESAMRSYVKGRAKKASKRKAARP